MGPSMADLPDTHHEVSRFSDFPTTLFLASSFYRARGPSEMPSNLVLRSFRKLTEYPVSKIRFVGKQAEFEVIWEIKRISSPLIAEKGECRIR